MHKPGLTENEFNKYAGRIKRHVPLNDAIVGKIKKVATIEQVLALHQLEKEYPPNKFEPMINIRRSLPTSLH